MTTTLGQLIGYRCPKCQSSVGRPVDARILKTAMATYQTAQLRERALAEARADKEPRCTCGLGPGWHLLACPAHDPNDCHACEEARREQR